MNKGRFALSLFLVIILQTTFLARLEWMEASPSLFIVYIVGISLLHGPQWGGYTGLGLGLLEDIMFFNVLGVHALLYFLSATMVGRALNNNAHNLATGTLVTAIVSAFVFLGNIVLHLLLRLPITTLWMISFPMGVFILMNAVLFPFVMLLLRRFLAPTRARRFRAF